jgi:microcystin-dependent protein
MGLETSSGIWDLVETWPLQSDKIRHGAGHFRNFKGAVKNSFPNITAPVTATATALNSLPANFSTFLTELLKHVEKKGSIKIHDLTNAPIPEGWVVCDGQTVSGYGTVPDLRDRFVVGAGLSYNNRDVGGSISKTTTANGGHTPVIQGTALSAAQMPAHTHSGATFNGSNADNGDPGQLIVTSAFEPSGTQSNPSFTTGSAGAGAAHTHGADAVPNHTHDVSDVRPPYYAVVWIVKVTDFVMP